MRRNRSIQVAEFASSEPAQQLAVVRSPIARVAFQRLPDALRQRLFDLGELVLTAVLFFVFCGIIAHPLFVHERIVVVVDPHHAIERMGQCPIERRAQSLRFRLQRIDRRPNLEIARSAALDGDGKLPAFERRIAAGTSQHVAHLKVILDIALKQIAPLRANATHHGVLSER